MGPSANPRVKICCLQSVAEARLAVDLGADAVGLVSAMPSGPGPIPDALIAEIARAVPPPVATFLLTCRRDAVSLVRQVRAAGVSTVQLVDIPEPDAYDALEAALPAVKLVQVVHVRGEADVALAETVAGRVHAVLLDSGDPDAPVRVLGGTGRVHEWSLSVRIRESLPVPVWLAGGLTPENVAEAIRRVRPFGVDVCSGLRPGGRLDRARLAAFVEAVRAA